MFVGHYGASFLGKAAAPRVPLWVLLIAAQLVDVAWAVFILLGIERFHLDPTLPSNPLVLEYMPYTHSLLGTVAWAAVAGAAVAMWPRLGTLRAAVVTGLVVCSHWALDVLVHRSDMTLAGGTAFGLALWNHPFLAYAVEIAFLVGTAAFMLGTVEAGAAERRAVARGVGVLVVLQTLTMLGPLPPSPSVMVVALLATFLLIAWAAARLERRPA